MEIYFLPILHTDRPGTIHASHSDRITLTHTICGASVKKNSSLAAVPCNTVAQQPEVATRPLNRQLHVRFLPSPLNRSAQHRINS